MSYSIKSLLNIELSFENDCNGLPNWIKVAELKRGTRTIKRKATKNSQPPYAFHVLEIRLTVNGKKSSGLSFSADEFTWLMECLNGPSTNSNTYEGERQTFHYTSMNNGKLIISCVDDQKVFSVLFNKDDIKKLKQYEEQLKLALNLNQFNKGSELYNLFKKLFVANYAEEMEKKLKENCSVCKQQDLLYHRNHAEELAKEGSENLLQTIFDDYSIENEFGERLEKFFFIMNISESEKEFIKTQRIPELKSNKAGLLQEMVIHLEDTSKERESISNFFTFLRIFEVKEKNNV